MRLVKFLKFCIVCVLIALTCAEDKKSKTKPNIKIEVVKEVNPCSYRTKDKDLVKVHVVSYFGDGKKFDSSVERKEPMMIQLGMGQVIKGLDKGLMDMCAGEKRVLTVPPRYAYGSKDMLAPNGKLIPGGSTLIFEVELLSAHESPEMSEIFKKLDVNKNGFIEMEELYEHLDFMSRSASFPLNLEEDGMRQMVEGIFSMADKDRDGALSEDEFIHSAIGKASAQKLKQQKKQKAQRTDL